jgi:hypothetical protein
MESTPLLVLIFVDRTRFPGLESEAVISAHQS